MGTVLLVFVLFVSACGGGTEAATEDRPAVADPTATPEPTESPTAEPTATAVPTAAPEPTPIPTPATPPVPTRVSMEVTGDEELVFDWTTDQCEPEHIPDIAARAFRDADGQVQLTIGHYVNYRMVGPELDSVANDCTPVLGSTFDADPSQFDDSVWLGGLHTTDGETIYAIVHNEYRGDTHDAVRPGQCPSSRRFTCLDTSMTLYVSRDGGDSYAPIAPPPGHLVASLPYVFDDEGVPSGLRQPSNIVSGRDGYVYVFSNVSDYPAEEQWVCAMRTDDLEDPTSWRYWDGTGFEGQFVDPYRVAADGTEKCAPLAFDQLNVSLQEAVLWDESIERFVMVGTTHEPGTGERWGLYYSTSEDLVRWEPRQLLMELPSYPSVGDPEVDSFYAYVSMLDPDSASRSFDTSNGTAYVYITRFHAGTSSLDRDLVRFPVSIKVVDVEPPDWTFDTDGDTESWFAANHIADFTTADGLLRMRTDGDDPYLVVPTNMPADFGTLHIRMRISGDGGDRGQVFFGNDRRPEHVEQSSKLFNLTTDGEFHDYELDMASVVGWNGTITSIRLDVGSRADAIVEIDRIWLD